jgi:hypothetical protein
MRGMVEFHQHGLAAIFFDQLQDLIKSPKFKTNCDPVTRADHVMVKSWQCNVITVMSSWLLEKEDSDGK